MFLHQKPEGTPQGVAPSDGATGDPQEGILLLLLAHPSQATEWFP